jgi:hypothetical protein
MEAPQKRRRGRARKQGHRPRVMHRGCCEVQRVLIHGRTYVQRYNTCGKRVCHCRRECPGHDPDRPGHGPYWYRELIRGGKTVRRYLGSELRVEGNKGEGGKRDASADSD